VLGEHPESINVALKNRPMTESIRITLALAYLLLP